MKHIYSLLLVLTLSSCAVFDRKPASLGMGLEEDPYLWLEEVQGEKALAFAKQQNEATFKVLKNDKNFKKLEPKIRKIALAKDRLPGVIFRNNSLYNFWQDKTSVRGLYRRTTVEEYKKAEPNWEVVIDFDKLAKDENENWVYKAMKCLEPDHEHCLLSLSRGGKDAVVVREFNLKTKSFVTDGFVIPEAKNQVSWLDKDTLLVGSDYGPGSLSDSGYPIIAKKWKRGTPLSEAVEVFRGEKTDVAASSYAVINDEGTFIFHSRGKSFFEDLVSYETPTGERIELPMPTDSQFNDLFKGDLLFTLRSDLKVGDKTYVNDSLVALPLNQIQKGEAAQESLKVLFTPSAKISLSGVSTTKSKVLVDVLDNVKGKILQITKLSNGEWKSEEVPLGKNGMATVTSTSNYNDTYLANYTDFLTPSSIYLAEAKDNPEAPTLLKHAPERFISKGMVAEQFEATGKDGTKIPYFVVRKSKTVMDGRNPTLLYGYGGFEISMTPAYLETIGKLWLEDGGVYVLANIRGGGEFGPAWHQAALRENRQRAFDDFAAVAEDVISRKITSPKHLGIRGGSNGGLLTGTSFVQRPDLFNAVLVEVPLLDMLRYHKLLAGASWMEEYGNPDDETMREAILKYSPYQNVKKDVSYPEVFFLTSTADDRVHPGHARKMVAKMIDQGHKIFYYENTEGGHGGSANIEQRILWNSLEYTYLWRKLSLSKKEKVERAIGWPWVKGSK